MLRKTLITAATITVVISSASAFATGSSSTVAAGKFGGGVISFTGSVTEAPCSIPPGEVNQTIDLGAVSGSLLNSSSAKGSEPVTVKINLKNCDLGTDTKYSKASLKFMDDGKLDAAGKNKGLLVTRGSSDVAVQLLDNSGRNPIDLSSDTTMKPSTETSLTTGADSAITFMAHLIGTSGSVKTPSPGSITAQVTYQLDYH